MTININEKLIGRPVAVRGIGSGVNVGVCAAVQGTDILFEPGSFFCSEWRYSKESHGAFHSLANGDVYDGKITLVENDTIISDVAQKVICSQKTIEVLKKIAKP